jgi:hypothetical protein
VILPDVADNAYERPAGRHAWRMQITLAAWQDCSEVRPIEVEERWEMEEAAVRQHGKAATRRDRMWPRGDVRGRHFGFTFGRGDASSCVAEWGAVSSFLLFFRAALYRAERVQASGRRTDYHRTPPLDN